MNLLNMLMLAADEEQLRQHPLSEHAAASQGKHLCQHYALLLASVLTSQPAVSEAQTRLLRLLLDALKLGDIRAQLFEQARELSPNLLIEAARLIREAGFAQHLVLDALVLLRLDAPLNEEVTRLAGELASFFGLDEGQLATRAKDAVEILGLSAISHEEGSTSVIKTWNGEDEAPSATAERQPSLADFWPGQLSQPLTVEALKKGLKGGVWVLETDQVVNEPWQAENAVVFFRNGATLTSFIAIEKITRLSGCRLFDPVMRFKGEGKVFLDNCKIWGSYDPADKSTALDIVGKKLTVTRSQFVTRNARAIALRGTDVVVRRCRFIDCGHAGLDGGAIWNSKKSVGFWMLYTETTIEDSYFENCLARHGGAIFGNVISGISRCKFIACVSGEFKKNNFNNIAIHAMNLVRAGGIVDSEFHYTSVCYEGIESSPILNCLFVNGDFYCKDDLDSIRRNNSFHGGNARKLEI